MGDYLQEFSNNLATHIGPLLALFGEPMTKQFLSECTSILDYIIFAMDPIGIITAAVSAIRVCGGPYMRAFIGRDQEGAAAAEVELCTSTGRDVCEMFTKGGITRGLGRPSVLELLVTRRCDRSPTTMAETTSLNAPMRDLWIYRKYLKLAAETNRGSSTTPRPSNPPGDEDRAEWGPSETTERRESEIRKKPEPDTDLPNLSLNVGIIKPHHFVFWAATAIGICVQGGVLVLAVLLSTAPVSSETNNGSGGQPPRYAPSIFIIGTVVMCSGMLSCAALIGSATYEESDKGRRPVGSKLIWLQPGDQRVGDQLLNSDAIFETNKNPVRTYTMSTTDKRKRYYRHLHTLAATSSTMLGFIAQFIGLRGLNAWVSIAQLAAIVIMSFLRGLLRMQRRNQKDNQLRIYGRAVHGHELDWLAVSLACRLCTDARNSGLEADDGHTLSDEDSFHVVATSNDGTVNRPRELPASSPRGCLVNGNLKHLFRFRRKLAILTGNVPSTLIGCFEGRYQTWKTELVHVREKSLQVSKAICGFAAAFDWQKPTNAFKLNVDTTIHAKTGFINKQTVGVDIKQPSETDVAEWSIDTAAIEALLGLWVWSLVESSVREVDSGKLEAPLAKRSARTVFVWERGSVPDVHWNRRTIAGRELYSPLGADIPQLYVVAVQGVAGTAAGVVKLWTDHPANVYPLRALDTSTSKQMCSRHLHGVDTLDLRERDFKDIKFSLRGTPTRGCLESDMFEEAMLAFVDHGLGTRSEAALCLLSALGDKVTVDLTQETVTELVEHFLSTQDFEVAEEGLRWALLSARNNFDRFQVHNNSTEEEGSHTGVSYTGVHPEDEEWSHTDGNPTGAWSVIGNVNNNNPEEDGSYMDRDPEEGGSYTERDPEDTHMWNLKRLIRVAIDFYRRSIRCYDREAFHDKIAFLSDLVPHTEVHGILKPTLPATVEVCRGLATRIKKSDTWPPAHDCVDTLVEYIRTRDKKTFVWALFGTVATGERAEYTKRDESVLSLSLGHFFPSSGSLDQYWEAWSMVNISVVQIAVSLHLESMIGDLQFGDRSMLFRAVQAGDNDLASLIHQHGAYVNLHEQYHEMDPVMEAARLNNYPLVRLFLGSGEKLDAVYEELNRRALFRFAKNQNTDEFGCRKMEIFEDLLKQAKKQGWSIDAGDQGGRSPLSWAASLGDYEMVDMLLRYGASGDMCDDNKRTSVAWAVMSCDQESEGRQLRIVRLLQHSIAKAAIRSSPGYFDRILNLELQNRDSPIKKSLFIDRSADEDIKESSDWTGWRNPFSIPRLRSNRLAAEREKVFNLVSWTLSLVSQRRDMNGHTPFDLAVIGGFLGIVKQLYHTSIRSDSNVDNNGTTNLSLAALNGRTSIVKILLEDKIAPTRSLDHGGRSALMFAANAGHVETVKVLLEHSSHNKELIEMVDNNGQTALTLAAWRGRLEVVEELLSLEPPRRPNVNTSDRYKNTPLILATQHGEIKVIEALLKPRDDVVPDVDARNREGWTALCYAIARPRPPEDANSEASKPGYSALLPVHPMPRSPHVLVDARLQDIEEEDGEEEDSEEEDGEEEDGEEPEKDVDDDHSHVDAGDKGHNKEGDSQRGNSRDAPDCEKAERSDEEDGGVEKRRTPNDVATQCAVIDLLLRKGAKPPKPSTIKSNKQIMEDLVEPEVLDFLVKQGIWERVETRDKFGKEITTYNLPKARFSIP